MCGIAGYLVDDRGDSNRVLERQLEVLAHRGPDSFGIHRGSKARIGQTRLAVIDLETGDPPITNEDGRLGVAFNGEIYNFKDLRVQLAEKGHRFSTQGDTEVLAHLAEDLPAVDFARSLEGMFAFAIWDEDAQNLTLGRDRLGKKPLYYWASGPHFVFASEIKGLLVHPSVPRRLDGAAIPSYLRYGYVPSPQTFFDEIKSLPPGHILEIRPGGEPQLHEYWRPPLPGVDGTSPLNISLEAAAEGVRDRLEAAIQRRLFSDVPLGAFLSGGMDSSVVVALMAKSHPGNVQTFTIGFEGEPAFDERKAAREISSLFDTDHTEFIVRPDAVALIDRLVTYNDQPFGDTSFIPMFLLAELTRQHVKVALSGDGGDEIFAGYERFAAGLASERFARFPSSLTRPLTALSRSLPPGSQRSRLRSVRRFLADAGLGLPGSFIEWQGYIDRLTRRRLLEERMDLGPNHEAIWERSEGAPLLTRLMDLNLGTYLLEDLLPKMDRMTMAHALEVRSPFLDRDLLQFALRLPPQLLLRRGTLKRVLKVAVKDLLPPSMMSQRKKGFGVPIGQWFRNELRGFLTSRLTEPHARVKNHVSAEALDALVGEHLAGNDDHGEALWTLLTLEVFLRRQDW